METRYLWRKHYSWRLTSSQLKVLLNIFLWRKAAGRLRRSLLTILLPPKTLVPPWWESTSSAQWTKGSKMLQLRNGVRNPKLRSVHRLEFFNHWSRCKNGFWRMKSTGNRSHQKELMGWRISLTPLGDDVQHNSLQPRREQEMSQIAANG